MPAGSPERTESRKCEIVEACEELYKTMNFKDITIKEIASYTSFSRPSIYNYFETKEEIFLALFQREYIRWNEDLRHLIDDNKVLSKDEYASKLAHTLDGRINLLKLLSMNMYDMEDNSRIERLTEFKTEFGRAMKLVRESLEKFFPKMTEADRDVFIYSFFPYMYGIYPYTVVTDRQKEAMKNGNVNYKYYSTFDMTYKFLIELLSRY